MTTFQQYAFSLRKRQEMKHIQIRNIAKGSGRRLKCEEFPELPICLEYVFGEGDRIHRSGGGLEAHPKLLDTTLYKALDNATSMKQAKDFISALNPNVKGTHQAKAHHHVRGITANISLHKPPNTAEIKHPINAHWSTANVNYLVDLSAENPDSHLVDSKDAKCVVCGDIDLVLRPGKSWQTFETPDHTFDQSRKNAVTPISHLLMETKVSQQITTNDDVHCPVPCTESTIHLTRTGQAITLINISFFEPETVFRVFNEFFYLLSLPSLDAYFRNPKTGKLKEVISFVVDNGPSEAPSNLLVKLLLVRLRNLLNVDRVTQISFAEYLSKRNYVERVHAVENNLLSAHGPFNSKQVHSVCDTGSEKHKENMEKMAQGVVSCLNKGSFGQRPLLCFRGIADQMLFDDEDVLKTFAALSDYRKQTYDVTYAPVNNAIMSYLENVWGVNKGFVGSYSSDYKTLQEYAYCDKYSTTVYRDDENWTGTT
ncbi:Hypothetical predicted protein [Paramuricea clavata]|uniref:Uncharacterized protein n=1 Tax=Paramuricea clavata TaxID=317549 RepID=A0A6S7JGJ8_PARCT|nr:Hypothetical predicted protein [Paramuricea clavata]